MIITLFLPSHVSCKVKNVKICDQKFDCIPTCCLLKVDYLLANNVDSSDKSVIAFATKAVILREERDREDYGRRIERKYVSICKKVSSR